MTGNASWKPTALIQILASGQPERASVGRASDTTATSGVRFATDNATRLFQKMNLGGAEGNRTPDLCSAIAALSHLSYGP